MSAPFAQKIVSSKPNCSKFDLSFNSQYAGYFNKGIVNRKHREFDGKFG